MTIPKEAIEKAIEGGWKNPMTTSDIGKWSSRVIALDPLFWQALGKSLGWSSEGIIPYYDWHKNARCFYDLILTNQNTDKFWADLLASK